MDFAAPSRLVDHPDIRVDHVRLEPDAVMVEGTATVASSPCPSCGQASDHVHSRYLRTIRDLPWQGRVVTLSLRVRKFRCLNPRRLRAIFCEWLPDFVQARARTTARQTEAHRLLGLALGGEAGARVATSLSMPTSTDTLLRRVKANGNEPGPAPRILGIDDWAIRKGQRYGTILIDLERRRILDLLPGRNGEALKARLKAHPEVEIVSRDRWTAYGQAVAEAAPQAKQIADRWHLLKNLREAAERLFDRRYRALQEPLMAAARATTTPRRGLPGICEDNKPVRPAQEPESLTAREQVRQAKRQRRMERFDRVHELRRMGQSIRRSAIQLDLDRETVARYLRHPSLPDRRSSQRSSVAPCQDLVRTRLDEGCVNAAELHRELSANGYRLSYSAVQRFVRRHMGAAAARRAQAQRTKESAGQLPSSRRLAFALIRRPDERTAQEEAQLGVVAGIDDELAEAVTLATDFAAMIRRATQRSLSDWLSKSERSACPELRSFARRLRTNQEAVQAAMTETWSNGAAEGHVNRLKTIKRQMYCHRAD
jgi:transposase